MDEDPGDRDRKRKDGGDLSSGHRSFKKSKSEHIQLAEDKSKDSQELVSSRKDTRTSAPPAEPARYISREAMAIVREQLCQLTVKNRGMKASMQEMRVAVVGELMSIMKTRRIILEQLGKHDLDKDMRQPYQELLAKRQVLMVTKEDELLSLEKLLGVHESILEHADSACTELEEKIQAFEQDKNWDPPYTIKDFPGMSALARLTGGGETYHEPVVYEDPKLVHVEVTKPLFTMFLKLPIEIRLQIWEACLPGSRIIAYDSRHNRRLKLLSVCHESRTLMEKTFARVLCPGTQFPVRATNFNYVNKETDIVVRDLTLQIGGQPALFDSEGQAFYHRCSTLFSGLARVKHLALAFDLLSQNGGDLFAPLQACCPQLQTITLFPKAQLEGVVHRRPYYPELRFLDLDSNLLDFVSFKWTQIQDRKLKQNSRRGVRSLLHTYSIAMQYKAIFPQYLEHCGQNWNPILKVCMLTKWNEIYQGFQTRTLDTDRISGLHQGEDGKSYDGFVESNMVCDANGEILSRYDGMKELFGDI